MTLYNQLEVLEKKTIISELEHAMRKNDMIFVTVLEMIEAAKHAGILKDEKYFFDIRN